MKYETIPQLVEAFQAPTTLTVRVEEGTGRVVKPGEWVVTRGGGVIDVLTTEAFNKQYRPVHVCNPVFHSINAMNGQNIR